MIDHEARKSRLGASEVAAILGENPDMTPLEVWEVKTGRRAHFEGNEHTRRGNRQEQSILDWLEEDLGYHYTVERNVAPFHYGETIAWATPDGIICYHPQPSGPDSDMVAGAEAKSTLKRIKDIEEIPTTWIIQCQWGMMCTGLKVWHLAIHGPMVCDYQRFPIHADEKLQAELLALATKWWEKHIVGDVQPEPINTADVLHLWPIDNGDIIEAVPTLAEAIERYKELGKEITDKTKEREALKDRITPAIGGASMVTYMGQKLATYKYQARAAYSVEAGGGRVLRV